MEIKTLRCHAVPLLRGSQGGCAPLTAACASPHFGLVKVAVFITSLNDKTTDNDGKSNNYVQT